MNVCVYAIAKNEEKNVKAFMEWAQKADFVMIADTGSTDKTKELFSEYENVEVFDVELDAWRFDEARNISLNAIPSDDVDMCVNADLDEVFPMDWREKMEEKWVDGVNRLEYDYEFSPNLIFKRSKVHSRDGFAWKYPVHEELEPLEGFVEKKAQVDLLLIQNADNTKVRSYFDLLKLTTEEFPENQQRSFWYMRELVWAKRFKEAIDEGTRYLSLSGIEGTIEKPAVLRFLGDCYGALGQDRYAERSFLFSCFEEESPESWSRLAAFYMSKGNMEQCYSSALRAYSMRDRQCGHYACELSTHEESPLDMMSVCSFWMGMKDKSLEYAELLVKKFPNSIRYKENLDKIKQGM